MNTVQLLEPDKPSEVTKQSVKKHNHSFPIHKSRALKLTFSLIHLVTKFDLNGYEAIFRHFSPLTVTINIFPCRNVYFTECYPRPHWGCHVQYTHITFLHLELLLIPHVAMWILYERLWTYTTVWNEKKVCIHVISY